jgi:hypothetical protein
MLKTIPYVIVPTRIVVAMNGISVALSVILGIAHRA